MATADSHSIPLALRIPRMDQFQFLLGEHHSPLMGLFVTLIILFYLSGELMRICWEHSSPGSFMNFYVQIILTLIEWGIHKKKVIFNGRLQEQ